jgi:hypothetical protein
MPNGDELTKEFTELAEEFETPFSHIQEYFPGYRMVLAKLSEKMYWEQKRLMKATEDYEKFQALQTQWESSPALARVSVMAQPWEAWRWAEFVKAGKKVPEDVREAFDLASAYYARSAWTMNITQAMPYLLADPESGISSAEDVLAMFPNPHIDENDRTYAKSLFDRLAFLIPPSAEEPIAKTPEELLEFLTSGAEAKLELAGVHKLSVDELIKSFRKPLPEFPTGMTGKDNRSLMIDLAFSEEEIENIDSIRGAAESLSAAWAEESAQIELMRAGLLEAEIPNLSPGQWAKMIFFQPAMGALELLESYFNALPRPLAAWFITNVPLIRETPWAKEMRAITEEYKLLGEDSWAAYSKAFTESEANWLLKLLVDMVFDPTTYIGFGIATKITKPIPYVGKFVGAVEHGWREMWDIPFKGLRAGLRAIPKTPGQAGFSKARGLYVDFKALLERGTGKSLLRGVTPDDVARLGKEGIMFAKDNPQIASATIHGRVGMSLLEHDFIDAAKISSWLRRLGVAGEEITQQTVHNVNDAWFRLFRKVNNLDEVSNEMLGLLGAQSTKKISAKMANILSSEMDDVVSKAIARLEAPTAKGALDNAFTELRLVTERQLRSPQYKFARNVGRITSWSRMVERGVMSRLAQAIDRRVTAPMANQYLLFMNYGPMNIVESGFRSFLGGGEVLYSKNINPTDELIRATRGVSTLPYEVFEEVARMEMALIVPSTGRTLYREGVIPYITKAGPKGGFTIRVSGKPFKMDSLQKAMIDLPSNINKIQRDVYLLSKWKQKLVEVAPSETKAIATIVDDAAASRLVGLETFSRKEIRDITKQAYHAGLAGPEDVMTLNVPIKQMEANKAAYNINKTLDQCTEIQSIFKERIRNEVRTGEVWVDIDGYVDRVVASAKEFNISELEGQTRVLKNLVKDFTDNPPRDSFEFMRQMKEISDLTSGIGGRISDVRVTARARASQLTAGEREVFHTGSWTEIQRFVDEVDSSLNLIIDGLETHAGKLKLTAVQREQAMSLLANQRIKLNTLLNTRTTERTIISDWMARKPKFKTKEEATAWWNSLDSARSEPWNKYWDIQETLLEQEYLLREGLTSTMQDIISIPPVEVIDRLTPSHIAALWGGTGDDLSRSLIKAETMTLVGRRQFIAETRAKAARVAKNIGKTSADDIGFNKEAVGQVYDQILSQQGLDPRLAEPLTPMLEQFEEIRHELHHVYATKKIPATDYDAISGFLSKVSDDLAGLDIYRPAVAEAPAAVELRALHNLPARTKGLRQVTIEEAEDYLKRLKKLAGTEAPKEVPNLNEAIRALREGDLGAAGVAADASLSKMHKLYRIHHPEFELVPPPKPPIAAGERWMNLKDDAMLKAREQYMLDFTDYSEHNMVDAAMRMIFPFWTYEWQRYMWLPRAFLRTPGLATGIGRYMNYSDSGYIPIPGTDIQFNPLRGTVFMGGFRRLYMRDFPEYYDAFPGMEIIDYISRFGFYPGFHIMLPIVATGAMRGKPEWGELAPAWVKTGFDALLAVSPDSVAKNLSEQIFPDRYRSYLTILTLIEQGHDGVAIWDKIEKGTADEEETKLWGKAVKKASGLKGILMEQTGLFRLRPPEFTEFLESSKKLKEELLGVPVEVQDIINRRYPVTGMRVSDYYHLDPLQQKIMYEIEQYERWSGIISPLMPSTWQEEDRRIREYWEAVENINDKARETGFLDEQGRVEIPPVTELNSLLVAGAISPEQWISMRGEALGRASAAISELKQEVYPDVPVTIEEREARFAERGIPAPTYHPGQEMLWLYYEQAPRWSWNWEAERYEWDFNSYYGAIDVIMKSLPEPYKQRFIDTIMFNWTPMEQLYWTINRDFLRPYRLARELIMKTLTPEERAIIKRYEVAKGVERTALMQELHSSGDKLVSWYSSQLRDVHETMRKLDPELDAWLMFWGVVDKNLTVESGEIYLELRSRFLTPEMVR